MPVPNGDNNFKGSRARWSGGYWDRSSGGWGNGSGGWGNGSGSGGWGNGNGSGGWGSGRWDRGRGKGSGGRWSSSNRGRGSYDKYRPPSYSHSQDRRWGTDDRRHSGSLIPGSSLLGSSNRQSDRGDGSDQGGKKRVPSSSDGSFNGHDKGRGRGSADADFENLSDGSSCEGSGISSSTAAGGEIRTTDPGNHAESNSHGKRKCPGTLVSGEVDVEGADLCEVDETDTNKAPSSGMKRNRSSGANKAQKINIGGGMSVSKRREAKLKELEQLNYQRESVIAAREALAKEMEKKRMEQEEITIHIDAAKRFLALYDSPAAAAISSSEHHKKASTETPPPTANRDRDANGGGGSAVVCIPSPSTGPSGSSQSPKPPKPAKSSKPVQTPEPAQTPARAPRPAENRTQMVSAHAASPATRVPPETSSSGSVSTARPRSELSARGRGGSSARGKIFGSGPASIVAGSSVGVGASDANEHAGGASTGTREAKKASRKGSVNRGGKHAGNNDNSTNSSSSEDEDGGDGAVNGVNGGFGHGGSSGIYGYITSMPPVGGGARHTGAGAGAGASPGALTVPTWDGSKPSSCEVHVEEFPNSVPADGGRAKKESRGSKGVTEAGVGSFNILKQLMFRATRTKKLRAMAFNPVVSGLFAVCSADHSMDLWQYSQKNRELERVLARDGVTPGGGAHMAWNPAGTHLAIGHAGTGFPDHWAATIVGRDNSFGRMKLRSDKHTKPAQAVAWVTPSKNHQDHLVTGAEDGQVVIWTRVLDATSDLHKVAVLHSRHKSSVRSTCCPSISPTVVTGGADGRLVSFSIETASVEWEELLMVSNSYHPSVNELLEFPDNPRCLLVSAVDTSRSHSMFTMDTRQDTSLIHKARRLTWKRKEEKKPFSTFIYPSISPCGRYVTCAGDWNGCFNLWDVRSGRTEPMQSVLVNSLARVMHTAWHPDPESHVLMSLSNAPGSKSFALHLHGGVRLL